MPRRMNRRAPRRRLARGKRYARRRYGGVKVKSSLQPIPSRQICKMKYSQAVQTNVGSAYNYQFNLNSIYDPDRTGTGHQPYGHDTMATLYNRYRVISCSYVLQAYSGDAIRFGCVPQNDPTTYGTIAELAEQPRGKFKVQIPGGSPSKITGKVYLPALTGRNKAQYTADDRYQALTGASPAELMTLNLTALTLVETGTITNWTVTLEYVVEFFDPKLLAQS